MVKFHRTHPVVYIYFLLNPSKHNTNSNLCKKFVVKNSEDPINDSLIQNRVLVTVTPNNNTTCVVLGSNVTKHKISSECAYEDRCY
jgi:hypothetical protein